MSVRDKRAATTSSIPPTSQLAPLRSLLYERTGLVFDRSRNEYLRSRLGSRLDAPGNGADVNEYIRRLGDDRSSRELQELVNLVTVNETHFYREMYQFECLVASILPELAAQNGYRRQLKLWSVPCATGEEPYTLAMYLLERWARVDEFDIRIVGSDIDTAVLERARRGHYDERAVRLLPSAWREKYFRRQGERFQLVEGLRSSIELTRVNITNPRETAAMRDVDVIFCRNLLIYFDDESRRIAVDNIYDALAPGGFVCLGHSESMTRISNRFELVKFPEAIVYRKPLRSKP